MPKIEFSNLSLDIEPEHLDDMEKLKKLVIMCANLDLEMQQQTQQDEMLVFLGSPEDLNGPDFPPDFDNPFV